MPTEATQPSTMPNRDPGTWPATHGIIPRRMPDMQVVTKGWLSLRQERQPVEKLEKADRGER